MNRPFLFLAFFLCSNFSFFSFGNGNPSGNEGNKSIATVNNEIPVVKAIVSINPALGYRPSSIRAGLIYDVAENKIVWEKEMDSNFPIASITKMMVALITLEEIKHGKQEYNTPVTVSREASLMTGSKVNLKQGKVLPLNDLLKSAMIYSGNDAAYMLAEHIGGTEDKFVVRMNEKAQQLGMKSTLFSNSTGLPAHAKGRPDNTSTPSDLLILAKELLKHDELLSISCKEEDCINNGYNNFTIRNRNRLVGQYKDEIDGLKTGFTNNARYCIVATGKRCDYRVITIVLGVENGALRNEIVANMFNNYYNSIGLGKLGERMEDGTIVAAPVPAATLVTDDESSN